MLEIKKLTAGYGGPAIIEDVSVAVHEGEIVTLIGPNGAGKSTVLKSIFGLTTVTSGEILMFGQNLAHLKTSTISKRGIGYVPQGRSLFPGLTVEENLFMGAYSVSSKGEVKSALDYVYSKFPVVHQKRHQKAKLLSGGQQQMVALGRALMVKPQLLLLDEPSIGLAPKIVVEVFEKILDIKKDGTSILMVEQNATMALSISDRGYVLELGKNKFEGRGSDLLKDERIAQAYLGKR